MTLTRCRPSLRVHPITLVTALLAGVASACTSPTAPLPDGAPFAMEFVIGGFETATETWHVRGDTVKYYRAGWVGDMQDSATVVPTAEQWRVFWAEADRAGVRRWRGSYRAPHIVDGVGWHLRIMDGRLFVEAQGSNAFPDRTGLRHQGETTPAFRTFYRALQDLVGRGPVLADLAASS